MKLINKIFLLGAGLTLGLGSCKKRELYPYDSIELSKAFQTVKDAKQWNNGLYSQLRGRVGGGNTFSQDVQADQLNAGANFGNRNGFPHRWTPFLADDGALSGPWSGFYSGINNANIALDGFDKIIPATPAETAELSRYKGDAYLARAFYYSELMIRFAKPYEPASATTDLGVPLVLKYDLNAQPARATSKQVYDQIINDIGQAKTLLAAVNGAPGATRFDKNVVSALEARVRLYMQDWVGAKAAADAVIGTGTYPLINTQADLINMWTNDLAKEVIFQCFVSKPNEMPSTFGGNYLGFNAATGTFTPDFIPSQWVVDMYDNADIRKAAYFATKPVKVSGVDLTDAVLVNKFPGNPALWTAATTNYANTPKVFRVAELYVISAEAAYRSGPAGEAAALTTLNLLRVARGIPALVGVTGAPLLQAIKDERFRELAFEGFRLWDLKRWHEGFTRHAPQNPLLISTGTGYEGLSIAANADKFTWGIPTNDATINKNLVQNTGW